MDAMTALTSVMTEGAFEADVNGHILNANGPFVQLFRRIPGDNWRDGVAEEDRTLVDAFWNKLFLHPDDDHEAVTFRVVGGDVHHQVRAQAVTGENGEATSAVGIVLVEENAQLHTRFTLDPATGLPDRLEVLRRIEELALEHRHFTVAVVVLGPDDTAAEDRRRTASRQLLSVVRPNDLVAGSPDGTFLLCAADMSDERAAAHLSERVSAALAASGIVARIGYALPSDGVAPATLVREAEAGAYSASPGEVGFAA